MLLAALVSMLVALPERELITVRMVVSTNTVVVATRDDPSLWVTLLGVGTPESLDPRKPNFFVGKSDPKWLASWLAPGARALMERRGESASGRPLVLLYRLEDGYCWNAHLVRVGAAFAAEQIEFPEFGKLASMEVDAQRDGKGLWKGYAPPAAPKPAAEPLQVASTKSATVRVQNFDPSHFPAPVKMRYASQAEGRLASQQLLGQMMQGYTNNFGQGFGASSGQGYYRGPRQPAGYYAGGVGSSHKGGTYVNPYTNNHYQKIH